MNENLNQLNLDTFKKNYINITNFMYSDDYINNKDYVKSDIFNNILKENNNLENSKKIFDNLNQIILI